MNFSGFYYFNWKDSTSESCAPEHRKSDCLEDSVPVVDKKHTWKFMIAYQKNLDGC